MKTMTCMQLGGVCDLEFKAETFAQIAEMSKEHGREMFEKGDLPHIEAMKEMMELMKSPVAMQAWMEEKMNLFESL